VHRTIPANNTLAAQNVAAPPLNQQNASQVGNAAFILASLHDSPNSIETQQNSLVITPANGNVIVAGQPNPIRISTRDASQLKGAVVIGQDGAGQRQGSFTDAPGGPFIPFAGCGPNAQGDISGVIQQTGITADNSYSLLVYHAPACIPGGNVTFGGLSVTGSGFGQYAQTFIVTGSTCGAAHGTVPVVGQPSTAPRAPAAGQPQAGGPLLGGLQPSSAPSGVPQIPTISSAPAVVRTVTKVSETFTTIFVRA
jgi:hypothetical protein